MSFPTGFRWLKKSSWISLHRRNITLPLTENSNDCQNGCKSETIVISDARYTTRQIASMVGISLDAAHLILKHNLKMRRSCARWIPHLLTNEQKRARVQSAKMLLKQFPNYNAQSFANVVTGDETWVHFFEPKRKIQNKIWATKACKRPYIAKRTISVRKVMYAIFFTTRVLPYRLLCLKAKL